MSEYSTSTSSRSTDSSHRYQDTFHGTNTTASDSYERPVSKRYHERPVVVNHRPTAFRAFSDQDERVKWINDYRSSQLTYASTVSSDDEEDEEEEEEALQSSYETPPERHAYFPSYAMPSTPPQFAALFPSTRRLQIRHDDTTLDGNMNLRIDVPSYPAYGQPHDITLFHLRMVNLRDRQFSLRRYCRDSGREVCHSKLKVAKGRRPSIQHSLSSALMTLGIKADNEANMGVPLKRHDSGYHSIEETRKDALPSLSEQTSWTTSLEFSNYAHLEIRKRGLGRLKHYDFEFWGGKYSWKPRKTRSARGPKVSLHLYRSSSSRPVAHITSDILTLRETYEEKLKGGWVPPCSMWISDRSLLDGLTDIAE